MIPMLIDTHAHLDFPDFANDLEDVLRRAEEGEVKRVITIGTSIESSRRAIELAENYPSVYAAIGVHPSHVEEAEDDVITPLRELARTRASWRLAKPAWITIIWRVKEWPGKSRCRL